MSILMTPLAVLVRNALLSHGLENPIVDKVRFKDRKMCERLIADHIFSIMNILNLDINHNSLLNTPKRIAKMYIEEIFSGLDYLNFPKITLIENTIKIDQLITIRDINFTSTCEHHFIVFDGTVHISYIPEKYILGLSKIHKIVYFFSNRPQLQERLIQQILLALQTLLRTKNIAILINAVHYCIKARGIHDMTSAVTTTALGGVFKSDLSFRDEFFRSISY